MSISPVYFGQGNVIYATPSNNQIDRKNNRVSEQQVDGNEPKQLVGSTQTTAAKKGFKFVFKKLKNFIAKLLKGDEEAIKKTVNTYNTIDKIHKTADAIDEMTDSGSQN